MFYYYGAKNQLAKHYPSPQFNTIIEPFAGSAAYSCYHLLNNPKLNAVLIDKDLKVSAAWQFLLDASYEEIINYPKPQIGEQCSDFLIMTCAVSNASSKCKSMKFTERIDRVFEIQKKRLLKFWGIRDRIQFIQGNFIDIENRAATWFIDPPYQLNNTNKNTVLPMEMVILKTVIPTV